MPQTLFKAGQNRRLVAGFDKNDPAGGEAGLRQSRREEVLPRDTPEDAALGSCRYPGCPERCCCPIDRSVGPAGDLMQGPELETPSRKHPVDLSHAEWKDLAPTRRAAFETRDAVPEFGQNDIGRGRGHVRRSRLHLWYVLSLFSLAEESIGVCRAMSEICSILRTTLDSVRNMSHISDMTMVEPDSDLRSRVLARIESKPDEVWTPGDFADLGARAAVDKTLQRLATAGELRRIDRGLYDRPRANSLTGRSTVPDYRAVIRAVTRRDRARVVIDGMTAANDLGLTTAVPARIEVLVDARLKPIRLGKQEIHFKYAAPSRLYWADRPGMRVVQALHWMQDMLDQEDDRKRIQTTLRRLFADPKHGEAIREDLRAGLSAVPIWMQEFLREVLSPGEANL